MTAMLPAHLTESVNNLGEAAKAMTEEIRADRLQRAAEQRELTETTRKQGRRIMALLVIVAVLVAGLVTISVANRRLGVANSELNRQNAQIVEQIRSCTTAGEDCYEESRARTAEVAEQLLRSNIAVAICARTETDPAAIEECALARVMTPGEAEEPPPSGTAPDGEPVPETTE